MSFTENIENSRKNRKANFDPAFEASPFLTQMAKSFVMWPLSIVWMQTFSKLSQKLARALLSSNFALWASPRVQAKIEAKLKVLKIP